MKKICPMMNAPCMRDTGCVMGGFCNGDKTKEELLQWLDDKEKFAIKTLFQRSKEGLCWECGNKNLKYWENHWKGPRMVCMDCGHDQPTLRDMLRSEKELWRMWREDK